jgi:hypothetical protein
MGFSAWLKKALIFLVCFFVIDFAISQLLLTGLNKYFGLDSNSEIFINGSSMAMAGFDKTNLEHSLDKKIAFYTRVGVSLQDRNAMLHHYFDGNKNETEVAIYEVNPLLFSKRFTAENVYLLFLPFIDEPGMSAFVESKTSTKEFWFRKIFRSSRYNVDLITTAIKGYAGNYENQKHQVLDTKALSGFEKEINTVPVELDPQKIALFMESIELMKVHSKKIILVNMPIYSAKMKTFKSLEYENYLKKVSGFSKDNEVYFLDMNQSDLVHNPDYFADPLHLNSAGQAQVTKLLTSFIESKGIIR